MEKESHFTETAKPVSKSSEGDEQAFPNFFFNHSLEQNAVVEAGKFQRTPVLYPGAATPLLHSSSLVSDSNSNTDVELSSPKYMYYSTPKAMHQSGRNFIRHNTFPSRRINFTQPYDWSESEPDGGCGTPDVEFTKVKNLTTPDSGFCTPASNGWSSIPSSPISPVGVRSGSDRYMPAMSTPDAAPRFSEIINVSSSSVLPSDQMRDGFSSKAQIPISEDSSLDKSLDLQPWLATFSKTQASSSSASCTFEQMTGIQSKPDFHTSYPPPFQPTLSYSKSEHLSGVLSLPQLTPIPVIMAPAPQKLSFSSLPDHSWTATGEGQKRKALEELQPSTLNIANKHPESERPSHSYMDLIKMALESVPDGQMTLKEIITWIEDHFPYFRFYAKQTWKNSIRHNLSLHHDFMKVEEKRHGGKWKLAADAKKYAHRIPRPPGPQPILPKSMSYALVPVALAPVGSGTKTKNCSLSQLPHNFRLPQNNQAQLYKHQQEESSQHLQQNHPQQHQSEEATQHTQEQPQPEQEQFCQQPFKQHHLLHQNSQQFQVLSEPHKHPSQQPQLKPLLPLQKDKQAKEVKLHFRLTPQQKQLLLTQQIQQTHVKNPPEVALGPRQSTYAQPESMTGSKTQFSDAIKVPQEHSVLNPGLKQNKPSLPVKQKPMRLPVLAPKPSNSLPENFLAIALHGDRKDLYLEKNLDSMSSNSVISSSQDALRSTPTPGKTSQGPLKSRKVSRIADRFYKSKSFDVGSRTKMSGDLPKLSKKSSNSKLTHVMNLASMVEEDALAAEEIQNVLRRGELNTAKCSPIKNVYNDSINTMSLSHVPGVLENRDLNREQSECRSDLMQQAWEEVMSPLGLDENSQGSSIASGFQEENTAVTVPTFGSPNNAVTLNMQSRASNDCLKENSYDFFVKEHNISRSPTVKANLHNRSEISSFSKSSEGKNSNPGFFTHIVSRNKWFARDSILPKTSESFTKSRFPAASEPLKVKVHSNFGSSSKQDPSDSQQKPRFYRTKSRRKQVHVPLTIDLSPKGETDGIDFTKQVPSKGKVSADDQDKDKFVSDASGTLPFMDTTMIGPKSGSVGVTSQFSAFSEDRAPEFETADKHFSVQAINWQNLTGKESESVSDGLPILSGLNNRSSGQNIFSEIGSVTSLAQMYEHCVVENASISETLSIDKSLRPPAQYAKSLYSSSVSTVTHYASNQQDNSNLTTLPTSFGTKEYFHTGTSSFQHYATNDTPSTFSASSEQAVANFLSFPMMAPDQDPRTSCTQSGFEDFIDTSEAHRAEVGRSHHPMPDLQAVLQTPPSGTISDYLKYSSPSGKDNCHESGRRHTQAAFGDNFLVGIEQKQSCYSSGDHHPQSYMSMIAVTEVTENQHEPSGNPSSSYTVGRTIHKANEYPQMNTPPPADDANDSSFLNSSVFDNIDALMHASLTEPNSPLKDSPK
ncbi:forkhead box m1 protein [Plakobranchus ocellatus]|uniref:Forkhead box m1 protein n=1 Tax=Plakobranchus ocellatus TaxID=259542 RepID=A0AAV4A334_9GAST|nr:forkhead box m1 protein [Plakobranchus ocellatus]